VELLVTATDGDSGVEKVELFRGGVVEPLAASTAAPFTLSWDTTGTTDGLVTIYVQATDRAGNTGVTEYLRVIIVNQAQLITLDEGNTGTIRVPADYNGTQEVDGNHHWTNPAGIREIISVVTWIVPTGSPAWMLESTLGTQWCPHSGEVLPGAREEADTSPILTRAASESGTFEEGQFFAHLKPMNPDELKGLNLPYEFKVYLFE